MSIYRDKEYVSGLDQRENGKAKFRNSSSNGMRGDMSMNSSNKGGRGSLASNRSINRMRETQARLKNIVEGGKLPEMKIGTKGKRRMSILSTNAD
jgi:hypothetical protein